MSERDHDEAMMWRAIQTRWGGPSERPSLAWHLDAMWETDDPWRRMNRARRALAKGEVPPDLIVRTVLDGNGKKYEAR